MKICLIVLAALCSTALGLHQAVVEIRAKGISGTITFTEQTETRVDGVTITPIRVVADFLELQGGHNWHVHTLPVDQTVDPAVQCLSTWVGPHYDPFNAKNGSGDVEYKQRCMDNSSMCEAGDLTGKLGQIPASGSLDKVDMSGTLFLEGRFSIIGRSIVMHSHADGTNFECGTIHSQEEVDGASVVVLQATFISPIAGTMYFKQVAGEAVQLWGRMYWVNDTELTENHNWHIHMNLTSEGYQDGLNYICSDNVGPHYDPTDNFDNMNYTTDCNPTAPTLCEIGDLTGKHARISVAAQPEPYSAAFFFTDTYLNLTGTYPVVNRSVAIHEQDAGMPIIACAPLVKSETLAVSRYPDGDITFSQLSPFEDTIITTGDVPSTSLSVLTAALSPQTNCLLDSWPPTNDDTYVGYDLFNNSAGGEMTADTYNLGDLESRYSGYLTDDASFSVFDLPIYGTKITISNKALRSVADGRRDCGALLPKYMSESLLNAVRAGDVIMAKASYYQGELAGGVYFMQRDYGNGVLGNTYIIVDLYYKDDAMAPTTQHNWHVHQNAPTTQGMNCTAEIGPHFNPFSVSLANFNVSINSQYSTDCSPLYPLRCESGDMSNKHGQLQISPAGGSRLTYTYVDNNLALSGAYSIVGRSIGVHRPTPLGGALFDCAEIQRIYPAQNSVTATFTEGDNVSPDVVQQLTSGSDIDPGCVLVVRQEAGALQFADGSSCARVTMRVFGTSLSDADTNRDEVNSMLEGASFDSMCFNVEADDGAPHTVSRVSLTLLLVWFLAMTLAMC